MANPVIEEQIQHRVALFVEELSDLVRRAALEAVQSALGEGAGSLRRGRRGRPAAGFLATAGSARRKGQKRSPEELREAVAGFLQLIKQAGDKGLRVEEAAPKLGVTTKELMLPTKKLLGEKKISKKGQKRATRYYSK